MRIFMVFVHICHVVDERPFRIAWLHGGSRLCRWFEVLRRAYRPRHRSHESALALLEERTPSSRERDRLLIDSDASGLDLRAWVVDRWR